MSKIYSRGLNYYGQCGLGKLKHTSQFLPIEIKNEEFARVFTNYGMSFALTKGKNLTK
jgi:hypothetical protein